MELDGLMLGWAGWECFYPSFLDGMPRWLGRPKVVRAAQGGLGVPRWLGGCHKVAKGLMDLDGRMVRQAGRTPIPFLSPFTMSRLVCRLGV